MSLNENVRTLIATGVSTRNFAKIRYCQNSYFFRKKLYISGTKSLRRYYQFLEILREENFGEKKASNFAKMINPTLKPPTSSLVRYSSSTFPYSVIIPPTCRIQSKLCVEIFLRLKYSKIKKNLDQQNSRESGTRFQNQNCFL